MLLDAAIKLITRLITTEEKHPDYEHVVDLAKKYRAIITGEDIASQLIQFIQREDVAMFAQRCRLTRSITPAVAGSVEIPFNKVMRNDRLKTKIKLSVESREMIVEKMRKAFYGDKRKKSRGLDYWQKTRMLELEFIDPNTWVVLEWTAAVSLAEIVKPRPFEVSSTNAYNFSIINDNVQWLFAHQDITYLKAAEKEGDAATKQKGHRFTLYDEDLTVVFEQVDKGYLMASGYVLAEGESIVEVKGMEFLIRVYTPNLGMVPAVRIGYKRDKSTDGRTFVNPWHNALCYFDKMITTVSEFDLTMELHTFPQKIQYVQKCGGTNEHKCNGGWAQGKPKGTKCSACDGKGYKIHTTAQDAILVPMPDDPKEMYDLNNILVYKSPPIELIKFQNDYTLQLERQVHQAVFNSQVFVKQSFSGSTGGAAPAVEPTATQADQNMQSVYDTLEPFTEKSSEVFIDFVTMFAIIAGETDPDKIDILRAYPADFKLKTSDMLMAERKQAKDSGAPAFLIETIDTDLATIIYTGDEIAMQRYKVKRAFYPFSGKNEDEVAMLMASEFVRETDKVLYANFEQIFKELEKENTGFYLFDYKKQAELVTAKIAEFITALEEQGNQVDQAGFKANNPANDSNPADGNNNDNLE